MDNAIMAEGEFIDDENDGDCQAEDIDNFAEDIEEDTDEEDNPCQRWIDVKDLRNMTLDELKTLRSENSTGDPDRRVELPITKVVVRRLPPQLTVEDYLRELSELPSYNYIRLVPPYDDLPSRIGKRSSIYINFDTEQEAFWFKEKYNNMKFFDERGNSYIACVDFSFIQDVAQEDPTDDDALLGTLEESEMYKTFLKAYEEEPWSFTMNRLENIPTPEAMLNEILTKKVAEPDSTPLLQFLHERSQRKESARKEREQRRKERDIIRRKQKEEILRRRQKEKEEASKKKLKEKEDAGKRKPLEEVKDREKDNHKERKRERDRERQRERDRERRLRKEKSEREQPISAKTSNDQPKTTDGSGQASKDSAKQKDSKQKPYSGTITYSKSGNPTRWSENSGPRKVVDKQAKEDHKKSQEHLNSSKKSSSVEKLSVEKPASESQPQSSNPDSKDASKSAFGKPFPSRTEGNNTEESENKVKKENGSGDAASKANDTSNKKESNSDGIGATKKRIVKRVIKVKKVKETGSVENGDDATSGQEGGPSDSRPKKIIRVVKKSSKAEEGSTSKSSANPSKTTDSGEKAEAKGTIDSSKADSEKERKNKKGRPEIQIYRPGSLRGVSKSTSSSGDKERKSDNN